MHARQVLCQWATFSAPILLFLSGPVTTEVLSSSLERCLAILEHVASLNFLATPVLISELISKRMADDWCFPFYASAQGTLQKGHTGMWLRAGRHYFSPLLTAVSKSRV